MPEGYYSSGPNPNLRRFVDEHAILYNPVTDTYKANPFTESKDIENRRDPINDLHIYWSKKPYTAIRDYIHHYTKPGDIVLDPFCGSGGTALAALLEGRSAIASDLSPAATFITKNYCTPVNSEELGRAYEALYRKVKPELKWLYETRCDRCDGRAFTTGSIFSYIYQCRRCLSMVHFFDTIVIKGQTGAGKDKNINVCPSCYSNGIMEEIDVEKCKKFPSQIVGVSYQCEEGCKPKRAERVFNDPDPKKREYFNKYDLAKVIEIENSPIPYWYPTTRMINSVEGQKRWGLLWRPYHGDIVRVDQFFTKRNLRALSMIKKHLDEISDPMIRDALLFAFSGAIFNATIMYRQRDTGGGPQMGNYYIPPVFREVMVWTLFDQKVSNLIKAQELLTFPNQTLSVCLSTQDATDLSIIGANSIDYIFTDPPYAEKVQYGELNFFWEAWLGFNTGWLKDEIIINKVRGVNVEQWAIGIRKAMAECFRVLKPGRWLSLCYHDSSEGTWQFIQDIMAEIGFIPEVVEKTLYIDTGQKSYHQLVDSNVTKRDLVINFRKPRPEELAPSAIFTGYEDSASFIEKARLLLGQSLEAHPGATADRLYDELVSRMVRRGEFERHNFDELLRSVAEEANGRWYLLDTAGLVDEAESKKESAAAKRLEGHMQKYMVEHRDEVGVHYSDLFEQYLPIKDKPRRLLQDWLPEFFYKTTEGTWRPPVNDEERQQKAALRSSGALRKIKRFANALVDGVPPADRDKPENAVTLADWIRQCRRAGLFDLGRVMYEKGGLHFEELNEETQLLVEEDYQICVGRSEKKAAKPKNKEQQLNLMDD